MLDKRFAVQGTPGPTTYCTNWSVLRKQLIICGSLLSIDIPERRNWKGRPSAFNILNFMNIILFSILSFYVF